jgi:hypothetical protein
VRPPSFFFSETDQDPTVDVTVVGAGKNDLDVSITGAIRLPNLPWSASGGKISGIVSIGPPSDRRRCMLTESRVIGRQFLPRMNGSAGNKP